MEAAEILIHVLNVLNISQSRSSDSPSMIRYSTYRQPVVPLPVRVSVLPTPNNSHNLALLISQAWKTFSPTSLSTNPILSHRKRTAEPLCATNNRTTPLAITAPLQHLRASTTSGCATYLVDGGVMGPRIRWDSVGADFLPTCKGFRLHDRQGS